MCGGGDGCPLRVGGWRGRASARSREPARLVQPDRGRLDSLGMDDREMRVVAVRASEKVAEAAEGLAGQPDHADQSIDGVGRAARECGACRACCRVFDVHELGKARGELCVHADRTGSALGCTVYADRPGTCRAFECAWKQGLAGDDDRPDRIGIMFYLIPLTDGDPGLGVVELKTGAFESERGRALIGGFAARKPGRILVRRETDDEFRPAPLLIDGKPICGGVLSTVG